MSNIYVVSSSDKTNIQMASSLDLKRGLDNDKEKAAQIADDIFKRVEKDLSFGASEPLLAEDNEGFDLWYNHSGLKKRIKEGHLIEHYVSDLIRNGDCLKVLKDPDLIPLEIDREKTFYAMFVKLAMDDDPKKNLDALITLLQNYGNCQQFTYIVESFSNSEDIEKFIEIAIKIPDENGRYRVLKGISDVFAEKVNIGPLIKVANKIPEKEHRNLFLVCISRSLASRCEFEKSIEIANTILDERDRSRALVWTPGRLASKGKFDKAIEIAATISEKKQRGFSFREIFIEFLLKGDIDNALEISKKILDEALEEFLPEKIIKELEHKDYIERAIVIANSNTGIGRGAATIMCEALVEEGDLEKAIEIANKTLYFEDDRDEAYRIIAEALTKQGDFEKALEVVYKISDKFVKKFSSLRDISEEGRLKGCIKAMDSLRELFLTENE